MGTDAGAGPAIAVDHADPRAAEADATDGADGAEGVEEADAAAEPPEPAGTAEPERDRQVARLVAVAAIVAAVVPVLLAGVRGAVHGWMPTGDDAYSAVRAWDVFSSNPPFLGTWSSASVYTGHEVNHPGPLQFDLLAVPVRLLGQGAGSAVGLALINAAAVALIGWLVLRRVGPAFAALAMGASALLSLSLGSEILYDPWSQHAPLVPFSLFLVAVWCVVAGDVVALPIMVVAGSYAFQTHLSYTVLVPGLAALAVGATLIRLAGERRRDREGWRTEGRRRAARWLALTAAVALVCWAQPLAQQLLGSGEGNMLGLLRASRVETVTPGVGRALRAYGGTVAVPPMWLPPSFGSPSFRLDGSGRPTWLAASALIALAAALAVLTWRARSRGSAAVAAATGTALAALVLGWVTTIEMPIRLGMVATYARFMWPLGMFIWLAVAVGVLDEIRVRWSVPARRLALPGLAVAVVAGAAALPTVDNESATFPWTIAAVRSLDDDVVAALQDRGPVLVQMENDLSVGSAGPGFFIVLQEAGIPFYVDDEHLVSQLGGDRRYAPGDADVRLIVRGGIRDHPQPGEELVARWSPLSEEEEAEAEALSAQLRDIVAEHGVPLHEGAEDVIRHLDMGYLLDAIADARHHPDDIVGLHILRELWAGIPALYSGAPAPDARVFPADLMDRWCELTVRRERQPISVYLAPVS